MLRRSLIPNSASPITLTEFLDKIAPVLWPSDEWRSGDLAVIKKLKSPRIGLCVSGGADSMALAFLFRQVQREIFFPTLHLTALIVDHKARADSSEEAQTVYKWLDQLSIPSQILTMQWPQGVPVSSISNFESQARINRYRLLARACIRANIPQMFLGHHQDDQVETILMRLAQSPRPSVSLFGGIFPQARIPCCNDIYGAYDGEDRLSLEPFLTQGNFELRYPRGDTGEEDEVYRSVVHPKSQRSSVRVGSTIPFSSSGLTLHRPFLDFPKSRILATCAQNDVPFVSDPTNFDPRLTVRNAVRHMVSNYKLPRALGSASILAVHQTRQEQIAKIKEESVQFCRATRIRSFDLRSGSIVVCLPTSPRSSLKWDDSKTPAYFLEQLLKSVSPSSSDDRSNPNIEGAVRRMFPELDDSRESQSARDRRPTAFTINGAILEPVITRAKDDSEASSTWWLSRQPFPQYEIQGLSQAFKPERDTSITSRYSMWSEWILWDHRYWIRVLSPRPEDIKGLLVRPLLPHDLRDVRYRLKNYYKTLFKKFDALLNTIAPGDMRYTLPVLVDRETEKVSAFPTLGLSVRDLKGAFDPKIMDWQIRYKSLDQEFWAQFRRD